MALLMSERGAVRAVLGPTNTGKTHLAIERLLSHSTGMIGFPLRLLARENYDKIVREKGPTTVALITGEEKIIPPNPQWWVCTVESMPLDKVVAFLAVDEIQLCADPDRGHVFTDRLLHARGAAETMFLGAETIAGLIRTLVPEAVIENRPRFSTLSHAGAAKLTRLPRRAAVVAFSVAEVYEMAEQIRRHRGGAAVVLGALSPRTRNAQVQMYQAGEVDYLVATDAIGMGLNMDIDHVAFAGTRKFDGRRLRLLEPHELGQIAGRAGRHANDGAFGVTNNIPQIDEETVAAIESHRYKPLSKLLWRNRRLDFRSPKALLASLRWEPPNEHLIRMRDGEDHAVLAMLARDEAVSDRAGSPDRVQLLWDVCQVPDFRQMTPDHHAELLGQLFVRLIDGDGRLPVDWIAGQFERLDRLDGDIDTITTRIAHIRTLAYIAHRGDWLGDSAAWQERARVIEDRLSDALHDRLIQRFVDRRASVLNRKPDLAGDALGGLRPNGEVVLEGHVIGHVEGFQFRAHEAADARESRALSATAERLVAPALPDLVRRLETAEDAALSLTAEGKILWDRAELAQLSKGAAIWNPGLRIARGLLTDAACFARVEARLRVWLDQYLAKRFRPLFALRDRAFESGAAKGLAYRLLEGLGSCSARDLAEQIALIAPEDRKAMAEGAVRFGRDAIYIDHLLKPGPLRARAALTAAWTGRLQARPPRRGSGVLRDVSEKDDARLLGFQPCGPIAVRLDRFESVMARIRKGSKAGGVTPDQALADQIDCRLDELPDVLRAMGCVRVKQTDAEAEVYRLKPRRTRGSEAAKHRPKRAKADRPDARPGPAKKKPKTRHGATGRKAANPDSPFAVLKDLLGKTA